MLLSPAVASGITGGIQTAAKVQSSTPSVGALEASKFNHAEMPLRSVRFRKVGDTRGTCLERKIRSFAHMANKAAFRSMTGSQQGLWADGELVELNVS